MKDYIYVEFQFEINDVAEGSIEIRKLGSEFELIDNNYTSSEDFTYHTLQKYCGKISSETATLIKLSNPFLAERMHISYISDELKNKYRNR